MRRFLMGVAATVIVWHAWTVVAVAQSADKYGSNFGELVNSWARDAFKVCGLIAIALLLAKKVQLMFAFLGLSILCGFYIFALPTVIAFIRSLANTLAG